MELNENSLPITMKNYYEPAIIDTNQRYIIENNALYTNNLIQSYQYFELNYKSDTLNSSITEIEYNENNKISTLTERTNGYISYYKPDLNTGKPELITEVILESKPIKVYKYSYDQSGKLAMMSIQQFNENFSEEERASISKMTYEYDKKGNWIGIYTQENGLRVLITDQKIKYRK